MSAAQPDLFGIARRAPQPDQEIQSLVRARLHATLNLVRGAPSMPWDDPLAMIREDNAFRYAKDLLPPVEGAALWAEFNREMERLYALLNAEQGADPAGRPG